MVIEAQNHETVGQHVRQVPILSGHGLVEGCLNLRRAGLLLEDSARLAPSRQTNRVEDEHNDQGRDHNDRQNRQDQRDRWGALSLPRQELEEIVDQILDEADDWATDLAVFALGKLFEEPVTSLALVGRQRNLTAEHGTH